MILSQSPNKSANHTLILPDCVWSGKCLLSDSKLGKHSFPGPSVAPGSSPNTILSWLIGRRNYYDQLHMVGLTMERVQDTKYPARCPGRYRQLLDNQPGVRWDSDPLGNSQQGRWGAGEMHKQRHKNKWHSESHISTNTPISPRLQSHSWDRSQVCIFHLLARLALK